MEEEISLETDENYKKFFEEIKALIENSPLKDVLTLMHEDDSFLDELDNSQDILSDN